MSQLDEERKWSSPRYTHDIFRIATPWILKKKSVCDIVSIDILFNFFLRMKKIKNFVYILGICIFTLLDTFVHNVSRLYMP